MTVFPVQQPPLKIPGLVCWFDASSTPVGAVASWTDKSGNGRHAIQATGAQQLVCTANRQAGLNALVGTRTAQSHAISTFGITPSADCTIFVAAKKLTPSAPAVNDFIFDGILVGQRHSLVEAASNSKFSFGTPTATAGTLTNTNPHIHSMQGGTTGNYWMDGVAQFTNTNVGTNSTTGLVINARYTLSNASDIDFYEVIYYQRKLSATEVRVIEIYLSNKWGIAIS